MLTTKRFSDILRSKAVRTEAVTQGCSVKFRIIHIETPMLRVSFLIVAGLPKNEHFLPSETHKAFRGAKKSLRNVSFKLQ